MAMQSANQSNGLVNCMPLIPSHIFLYNLAQGIQSMPWNHLLVSELPQQGRRTMEETD